MQVSWFWPGQGYFFAERGSVWGGVPRPQMLFNTSDNWWGWGKISPSKHKGVPCGGETWWVDWSLIVYCWVYFCVKCLFVLHLFINTVVVTHCFLVSLLFQKNCSYLILWSLPFVFPIRVREEVSGDVVLAGVLNWRITFLNQDIRVGSYITQMIPFSVS